MVFTPVLSASHEHLCFFFPRTVRTFDSTPLGSFKIFFARSVSFCTVIIFEPFLRAATCHGLRSIASSCVLFFRFFFYPPPAIPSPKCPSSAGTLKARHPTASPFRFSCTRMLRMEPSFSPFSLLPIDQVAPVSPRREYEPPEPFSEYTQPPRPRPPASDYRPWSPLRIFRH